MGVVFGVDPGGSDWRIATLDFSSNKDTEPPRDVRQVELSPRARDAFGALGFYGWCEQLTPLLTDAKLPSEEALLVNHMKASFLRLYLGNIYDEHKNEYGWGTPDAIGVCHPVATPPLVRRALPMLFEGEAISAARRADFSSPPRETEISDGVRLCAIEAPLAGLLELFACGEHPPGEALVITGRANAAEATVVHASLTGDELELTLRASLKVNADADPAAWKTGLGFNHAAHAARPIIVFGEHLAPLAARLEQSLGGAAAKFRLEKEESLALGAARLARWCREKTLPGASPIIQRLSVRTAVPHDVGVICAGEGGHKFWHRLYRAGRDLAESRVQLPFTGVAPETLVFAERRGGAASASWLESSRWREHELRFYGVAALDGFAEQKLTGINVSLAFPTNRLAYRWSDSSLEIAPVT